jgi:hypothetical protein
MVYLMSLYFKITYRRITGWLVNVKLESYEKKLPCPNVNNYSGILLEGLRKTTKKTCQETNGLGPRSEGPKMMQVR